MAKSKTPQDLPGQGRPTKYKPEYDQMLIDHMAEGYTFESFAGLVKVDRDTIYHWCTLHKSFSDSKKIGRSAQLLSDEKILKGLTIGAIEGSTAAHIFKMKNCHKWTDRQEIAINDSTDEELLSEVKDVIAIFKDK